MSEWFKEWFNSEEYLEVYKHRNSSDAEKLLRLIFDNINLPKDSEILDAACGAGRHSILLSEKGFNVTGFDLSDTLLKIAEKSAEEKKVQIDFQKADIRNFSTDKKFSMIVNLFTSFGYFDSDEENFQFYKNIFPSLNKDGYLVFDYFNSKYLIKNLVPENSKLVGDLTIFENRSIKNERVVKNIRIVKNGFEKEFSESVKLYEKEKIIRKFEEIGYKIVNIFGNFNGDAFNEDVSERLIIICQK